MLVKIRQETSADYSGVFDLVEKAFRDLEQSDHQEHYLVERLRTSASFVPELSLVAEVGDKLVGHILLTKVTIEGGQSRAESLALAPVSVLPEYQGQGIGGMLIRQAHKEAIRLGFKSVVLLGHEKYYPRFGYNRADVYGILFPFNVPEENCMAIELVEDGLKNVQGTVRFAKEFYE